MAPSPATGPVDISSGRQYWWRQQQQQQRLSGDREWQLRGGPAPHPTHSQGHPTCHPLPAHLHHVPSTSAMRQSGRIIVSAGGASRLSSLRFMPSASAGLQGSDVAQRAH